MRGINYENIFDLDNAITQTVLPGQINGCVKVASRMHHRECVSRSKSEFRGSRIPDEKCCLNARGPRILAPRTHRVCARVARFDEFSYAITLPRLPKCFLKRAFQKGGLLDVPGCSFGEISSM